MDEAAIEKESDGRSISDLVNELLDAIDPDSGSEEARTQAALRFAANPTLRNTLLAIHRRSEVLIDEASIDRTK